MKLAIDIPEEYYNLLKGFDDELCSMDMLLLKNGTPLDHVFNTIKDGIKDEADYAYADFDQYKADILDAEADELPNDDFRYGMERAIEIINAYRNEVSS